MRLKLRVVIFLTTVFTIWWFGRPILESYRRGERLNSLREEVGRLEDEKTALVRNLEYLKSQKYVEREARDRLNMVKEGERVVVLPEHDGEGGEEVVGADGERGEPNWEKWRRLFFE